VDADALTASEKPMSIVLAVASVALLVLVLVDGFTAMILPRRVSWRYRPARLFYGFTWAVWRAAAELLPPGRRRQTTLSVFGPLSLLALFATWVLGLILAFALLHWSVSTALQTPDHQPVDFLTYLYLSGETFFTLGYGDVTASAPVGRALTVMESGLGFGFMAVIIGYLPVLYQAFSRRELSISLLDARAGSPPSAAQLLLRAARGEGCAALDPFLAEWERWAAEVLESHLSFPVLSFYRSQHDNQSWLAALTAVLDTCALLLVAARDCNLYQAQLTFAMARHAAVDLGLVFNVPPVAPEPDRLSPERRQQLWAELRTAGLALNDDPAVEARLAELRLLYEPFVNALARYFLFPLPPIVPDRPPVDNWQTSAWARRAPGIDRLRGRAAGDEHFD
jgi:hypothetical protein